MNPNGKKYSLQKPAGVKNDNSNVGAQVESKEKKTTKLSFDDYFTQWSGLATTKPIPKAVNTCKITERMVI